MNENNKRNKMETVKTLLECAKKDLEMKLWWAEEHNKEPQFLEEIPTLKQKIAEIDEALLRLFSVVGRSEQFYCELSNKTECQSTGVQCSECKEFEDKWKQ